MGNLCIGTRPRANGDTLIAPSTSTIVGEKEAPVIEATDPSKEQVSSLSNEVYSKLLAEIQRRDQIIELFEAAVIEAKQAVETEVAKKKHPAALRKERIAVYDKYGPITSESIDRALGLYKSGKLGRESHDRGW